MKLSIVIVNYNVEYFLEQCLYSVRRALQDIEGEVFVVDNNSVDGSLKMLAQKFPEVKVIANKENVGFSRANNQAIRISTGEYVLLLNPDTVVEDDTFSKCLELFEWARFRTTKGGVKVHTLLDVETQIPSFLLITEAKQNDVKAMDSIPYEASSYYVFDRAYNDFGRLARIDAMGCFFVVRAKMNMQYEVFDTKEKLADNILKDCRIILTGYKTGKLYSKPLRMVEYYDAEDKRVFTYLTNSNKISASRVAELYKNRWLVELFFKWLKQHLKIKKFWGTSENAVKIQIYVAIITYCLVAIVHHDMQLNRSLYEILQILGISLTDKTPLQELLTAKNSEKQEKAENRTLDLFDDLFLC